MSRFLKVWLPCMTAACFAAAMSVAGGAGNAERGKELYESRCFACHSIDDNRVGPMHKGLFGRKAGSVPDFDYSPKLRKSKVVWDEKSLDAWLTNPEDFIPGQKMSYSVTEAADRADLIAYLKIATAE